MFNNEKNRIKAEKGLARFATVMFALSVLSSSIGLFVFLRKVIEINAPDIHLNFFTGDAVYIFGIALFAAVVWAARFIDFYGVSTCGKMFFTELGGFLADGKFSRIRTTAMVFWGFIFAAAAFLSGFTSYNGSKIVSANAAPKIDNAATKSLISERQKAVDEATKIQRERLQSLQSEKAAAVQKAEAGINGETKRLAKRGNGWAQNEIKTATNAAARPYNTKIANAEKELQAAIKEANARYDKIEAVQLKNTDSQIDAAKQHGNAAGWLSFAFGLAPLAFGILGIGIQSLSEVSQKTERGKTESGAGYAGSSIGNAYGSKRQRSPF